MDVLGFLIQAALFYFAYKLGQWSVLIPMKMALEKLAKDKGINLQKVLEDLKSEVEQEEQQIKASSNSNEEALEIERVNGIYFAYGNQGRFLAQGPDFRTMMENIKQRFPGQSFRVERYNANLTEEETGRLIKAVFETFGDKDDRSKTR